MNKWQLIWDQERVRLSKQFSGYLGDVACMVATDLQFIDGVRNIREQAGQLDADQVQAAFTEHNRVTSRRLKAPSEVFAMAYPHIPDLLQLRDQQLTELAAQQANVIQFPKRKAA